MPDQVQQSASPDWGTKGLSTVTKTTHSHPNATLDPSKAKLKSPFVVCIVGASRGIGAGIATSYAKAGCSGLVLASRRISGLEETAAACKAINPEIAVDIVGCDIIQAEAVSSLAEKIEEKFGRLDVVAVNSGYSGPVVLKITETDPATFAGATNVNYVGTFHCAKYLIPLLLSTRDGAKAFIGVSSFAAFLVRGPIANTQYCVSKTAQLKLLEHIHEQYQENGLSCYAVHPGAVLSEMADETTPDVFRPYLKDSPELCGAMCVWLTKNGQEKSWLSGRLISANYDADELEARRDEIVAKDALKMRLTLP
ncbi:Short chain dehydrogenase citE [Pseudocercospora fuligena]|uniref:Short chain dehydrogenase citE n=1 Tax=Pseudocercospora fuligena TaxID=685502 RepID=A0A8H6RX18_9PEZI|nr:Short chain dehydrogenase citE [Pseudocercospora fuligena]